MLAAIIKPQAHESFLVQQFFKNAAEVWASSPHLRSKLDLQMKSNKNLGEHRKNRNCLFNREDAMRIQGFRGNCDFQGKLGMCPSLAEPDSGGIPRNEVSNHKPQANKSFLIQQFFKNVGEVQGEQP